MWSECRSAKHAPGHLATVGLAQRPLEPEAGRRGDGKRHCRFCVHARATRMRVLRARACGIDARDDKVSRRRSGRLSMNRSHFRTVAMKRENIGFKTKNPVSVSETHGEVNLRQTSRPGGRDTSFAPRARASLERSAARRKKKASAIRAAARVVRLRDCVITSARASERRRASSRLSIRHTAGARDAVLVSPPRSRLEGFTNAGGFATFCAFEKRGSWASSDLREDERSGSVRQVREREEKSQSRSQRASSRVKYRTLSTFSAITAGLALATASRPIALKSNEHSCLLACRCVAQYVNPHRHSNPVNPTRLLQL